MAKLFNRAKMTTSTTGTGTVSLGSASVGFQSFASAGVSNSDVVQYVIEDGSNFEIGTGTYSTSGTTLTRSPAESSNSNNAINLSGAATVSVTAIDDDFNRLEHAGATKVSVSATGASVTGNLSVSGTIPSSQLSGALPAISGAALTGIVSIPTGLIALWSGTNANIPTGWNLCDGNNGTPDLTNRFVMGRAGGSNSGAAAGANTVTLAETNLPSHTHSISFSTGGAGGHTPAGNLSNSGNHTHNVSGNTNSGGDHSHNFNTNTGNSGNHTHSGSTSNTGGHSHGMYVYYNGNTRFGYKGGLTSNSTTNNNNPGYGMMTNEGSHSHNFNTNGGGDHSHNFNANTGNSGNHNHGLSANAAAGGDHSHNFSGTAVANHTHNVSGNTGGVGSGTALTITPIHFTLAYIMKS